MQLCNYVMTEIRVTRPQDNCGSLDIALSFLGGRAIMPDKLQMSEAGLTSAMLAVLTMQTMTCN